MNARFEVERKAFLKSCDVFHFSLLDRMNTHMKAIPLLSVGCLVVGLLVGLTGCAWLKPPVDEGRGAVRPGDGEYWHDALPVAHESRQNLPREDFNSWANRQIREVREMSPSGTFHRGR
jgi:hypothetical protein